MRLSIQVSPVSDMADYEARIRDLLLRARDLEAEAVELRGGCRAP